MNSGSDNFGISGAYSVMHIRGLSFSGKKNSLQYSDIVNSEQHLKTNLFVRKVEIMCPHIYKIKILFKNHCGAFELKLSLIHSTTLYKVSIIESLSINNDSIVVNDKMNWVNNEYFQN